MRRCNATTKEKEVTGSRLNSFLIKQRKSLVKPINFYLVPYEVRLEGGNESKGRVEVFLGGEWGTVCNDHWDINAGDVVCRQLGYAYGAASIDVTAHFGQGGGRVWLRRVNCTGTETDIGDCYFEIPPERVWTDPGCTHAEDAGVTCNTTRRMIMNVSNPVERNEQAPNVTVRLRGGKGPDEGRVEVYKHGQWGTICDITWRSSNARVVCKQLGYGHVRAIKLSPSIPGSGAIWLSEVACNGNEERVEACNSGGWGRHNCKHNRDVAIACGKNMHLSMTLSYFQLLYKTIRIGGSIMYSFLCSRYCSHHGTATDAAVEHQGASGRRNRLGQHQHQLQAVVSRVRLSNEAIGR